jgi:hypothetical protein
LLAARARGGFVLGVFGRCGGVWQSRWWMQALFLQILKICSEVKMMPTDGLTKIREGVERLSCGEMIGKQDATHGLIYEWGLVDGNDHAINRHLADLNDDIGDSLAKRALLFDRPSLV